MTKKCLFLILLPLVSLPARSDTMMVVAGQGPSLQEAINQARSGTTIRVGEGIYKTDSALSIRGKRDLLVEGDGEVWIICRDVYQNVIEISDCTAVELRGIAAKHEEPLDEYECQGAVISITGSSGVEISDCELNGSGAMGVSIDNSQDVIVSGCVIQYNSYTAVYLYRAGPVSITHNRVFDNATTLQAYDSSGVEVYGNVIANNHPY